MKRIILAVIGAAAAAGLAACSSTAASSGGPGAASAGHTAASATRTPVSCSKQYTTWTNQQGKGVIAALGAVSSAETAGNAHVLTVTLKKARPAVARGARHPVPACADPRGYWDVLLMHVNAAAAAKDSPAGVRAAMKDVPKIHRQLTAELKQTT